MCSELFTQMPEVRIETDHVLVFHLSNQLDHLCM